MSPVCSKLKTCCCVTDMDSLAGSSDYAGSPAQPSTPRHQQPESAAAETADGPPSLQQAQLLAVPGAQRTSSSNTSNRSSVQRSPAAVPRRHSGSSGSGRSLATATATAAQEQLALRFEQLHTEFDLLRGVAATEVAELRNTVLQLMGQVQEQQQELQELRAFRSQVSAALAGMNREPAA